MRKTSGPASRAPGRRLGSPVFVMWPRARNVATLNMARVLLRLRQRPSCSGTARPSHAPRGKPASGLGPLPFRLPPLRSGYPQKRGPRPRGASAGAPAGAQKQKGHRHGHIAQQPRLHERSPFPARHSTGGQHPRHQAGGTHPCRATSPQGGMSRMRGPSFSQQSKHAALLKLWGHNCRRGRSPSMSASSPHQRPPSRRRNAESASVAAVAPTVELQAPYPPWRRCDGPRRRSPCPWQALTRTAQCPRCRG